MPTSEVETVKKQGMHMLKQVGKGQTPKIVDTISFWECGLQEQGSTVDVR